MINWQPYNSVNLCNSARKEATFSVGSSVVRAGGDADTNAAVACAILGAKYGFSAIPQEYVEGLIYKEQLEEMVSGMLEIV